MAIIVEEEKKSNPWFTGFIVVIILAVLGAGTYYLFFKPVPGIEKVIVPSGLKTISEISKINLDVSKDVAAVTESTVYISLTKHVNDPDFGVFGRNNPFSPF